MAGIVLTGYVREYGATVAPRARRRARQRCTRLRRSRLFRGVRRVRDCDVVTCAHPHGCMWGCVFYNVLVTGPGGGAVWLAEGDRGTVNVPAVVSVSYVRNLCTLSAPIVAYKCE